MPEREIFSPTDLLIDELNPRLEQPNVGQHKALQELARFLGRRLQVLAKDIVDYGIDPATLPIVMKHGEERGRYVVLEGNRRLAALRALESPEAIADAVQPAVLTAIRKLSKQYQDNPIEEIECVVVKDREEARHWIELRHTGVNDGAGVIGWVPYEVDRFRARGGPGGIRNQAIDFLVRRGELTREERAGRWGSTLDRLLRNSTFREQLGLEMSDKTLTVLGDEASTAKALKRVVSDLQSKKIKVGDVYRKAQIEAYAKTLPKIAVKHKSGEGVPAAEGGQPIKRQKPKTARVPGKRNRLIPRDCILNIPDGRLRDIERELRKLSLEDHTNAVSVLFRVFVELSADTYIDRRKLGTNVMDPLGKKLKTTLGDLQAQQKLTPEQAKPVRMASTANSFLAPSVTIMHLYLHNPHVSPAPSDLRAYWDSLQPYITALWVP